MLSNSSLRTASIEEENVQPVLTGSDHTGSEDHKKLDLRNISEENDETTSDERKKDESKLIDFSPEEVRTDKWTEEANNITHPLQLQQQQQPQQQQQEQQLQQQQQLQHENLQGQSTIEQMMVHSERSPEKQVGNLFYDGTC